MRTSLQKQTGVVIILAMLMVALIAGIAYTLLAQSARDTERTELILRDANANQVAVGALAWAKDALIQDWLHQKSTQLVDVMPLTLPKTVVEGYHVSAVLSDMQAYYNLNNLTNDNAAPDFLILLKTVVPSMEASSAEALTSNVIAWLKPMGVDNQLDHYYAGLPLPYRAAHRLMVHVSEFKLVKGMSAELYQALLPYITALPEVTTINPQTASAPVLMSLSSAMNSDTANALIELRKTTPLVNNTVFMNLPSVHAFQISSDKINTVSTYFRLETRVNEGDETWVFYTLLARHVVNGRAVVSVIYQNRGEI